MERGLFDMAEPTARDAPTMKKTQYKNYKSKNILYIVYIQYGTFPQSGNISVKRVTFPNRVTKHYPIEEHVTRFGVKKTVIPVISERADGCCKGAV